ncbi:HDOD domain-containing protein [Alteromonadaceae bacterium M269]|nr:HDOD domain-containing protein [Alteromonadaceae bacterium M269]
MTDKTPDIIEDIQHRFYNLLIGLEMAQEAAGVEDEKKVKFEQTEQSNARRQLLRVEKIAMRDKDLNERSEASYIESIRQKVHDELIVRLEEQLTDTDHLYDKVLGIHEQLPEVLDILSVRAASTSRIEAVIMNIPWLQADLLKMVNMPKYRKTDKRGKVMNIDNLRVALNFLGVENLKMVVPSLALRRWIPQITDPYPEIKTRLWEQAIGSSMSCKRIAEVSEVNASHAFTLGMLHEVGTIVVTKLYFRLFDQVLQDALTEAHEEKLKDEHAALTKITPDGDFLQKILRKYSLSVSYKIIKKMELKRVFITPAMEEFTTKVPLKDMSPIGKVLAQGDAYNKYRMLKQYKLIQMDEAKEYLRQFKYPNGALATLKATDLRRLSLSFDEE